jgi:hypothetical protein
MFGQPKGLIKVQDLGLAARETHTKGLARTQKLVHSLGKG